MHRKLTIIWLMLGLGSSLQIVASLSIAELIALSAAPLIIIKDWRCLKRDGVMPLFVLSLLVVVGCVVSSLSNHTPPSYVLRGLAVTCIVACSIVFSHWLLVRDPGGFKWYILMIPVSAVLSTFIFRQSVEMSLYGETAEEIMNGPIYWISRLQHLVLAPTKGWYLQTPWFINVFAPLFMAGFSILTSISGRSTALSAIGFAVLVIVGGKSRRTIGRVSRFFWRLCFVGIVLICAVYLGYKVSASRGWLGEDALRKYEQQTHGESGIVRLIVGGRAESFIGLLACRDKPIVGWGPWALDENGYTEEFMEKYGDWEDYQALIDWRTWQLKNGYSTRMLPCHAYITEFWAWYGVFGLLFILYIIYVFLRYLKQDVAAVPQWYAWLACSIPGMFWGIFFSPFADRFGFPLFVVACLIARAVRKGTCSLPADMLYEIDKNERW